MAAAYLAAPLVDATLGAVRLRAHQLDAASRIVGLLDEFGGALLADATGLGKTYVAIAVARRMGSTTVVAPAALRSMWEESLGRAGTSASVISYEACSRGMALPSPPDLLILDEAHHARNPNTRRYAVLARLAWGARVLLLTATPVHNRSRDIRSLLALFLGSRAESLGEVELRRLIVRRSEISAPDGRQSLPLPRLEAPQWIEVPPDPDTLHAIDAISPPVPPADGGSAHALLQLGLIRAWTSSEFALRETLRRRLRRAAAFEAALEEGRRPDRRELATLLGFDDAFQPALPGLLGPSDPYVDVQQLSDVLHAHVEGVRSTLRALDRNENRSDLFRIEAIRRIRAVHAPTPIVAFTQFADTARGVFRACASHGGVALVTGSGARVASGVVTVDEIVRGFDVTATSERRSFPLDVLITTDVLSEGLSLRRAGVLIHLDLPWTLARLEQRVGRLRRMGSPYRSISVHAIGPPVRARELVRVIRALQRKARLSSGVIGATDFEGGLPLLGARLERALVAGEKPVDCVEKLRSLLVRWREGGVQPRDSTCECHDGVTALALLRCGSSHRLIALFDDNVSETVCDVYRAARALCGDGRSGGVDGVERFEGLLERIRHWTDLQRGRDLVRPATDAPSPTHARVLNRLGEALNRAPRSQRSASGARMVRLRELVNAARGAGAELALQEIAVRSERLDLDALEDLLTSRATVKAGPATEISVMSVLVFEPVSGFTTALMVPSAETTGSPHPGPPRSSTHRGVRDEA